MEWGTLRKFIQSRLIKLREISVQKEGVGLEIFNGKIKESNGLM